MQTEKVDLENTVVDESQRQFNDEEASSILRQEKFSGKCLKFEQSHIHMFKIFLLLDLILVMHFLETRKI